MSELKLYANIGAEEVGAETRPRRPHVVRLIGDIAALWLNLFPSGTQLLDAQLFEHDGSGWPSAFGARPQTAAFPWLDSAEVGSAHAVPWFATAVALDRFRAEGLSYRGPSPACVAAVHDKGFAATTAAALQLVPSCLAPLIEVFSPSQLNTRRGVAEIAERVASWPDWTGHRALLKPRFGTSGRGQTLLDLGSSRKIERPRAIHQLASRGGAVLEPFLDRVDDLSIQLYVARDGSVEQLGATRQLVTPAGRHYGNRGVLSETGTVGADCDGESTAALAAQRVAVAAAAAGFYGPCGVDAFTFRGPDGEVLLRPVVELNARFTIGTIAVGLVRRLLEASLAQRGDAWVFYLSRAAARLDPSTRVYPLRKGPGAPVIELTDQGVDVSRATVG